MEGDVALTAMQATSSFIRTDISAKKATRKPLIDFKTIRTQPPNRNSSFHPQYWISVESYRKIDDHEPLNPDSFTCHQTAECAHPSRRAMADSKNPVNLLPYKPPSTNIPDLNGPPEPKQPQPTDEPMAKLNPNPTSPSRKLLQRTLRSKNQLLQRTTPADEPSQTPAVPTILNGPSSSPEQATKSTQNLLNWPHQLLRANATREPNLVRQDQDLVGQEDELHVPLSTRIIQIGTKNTRTPQPSHTCFKSQWQPEAMSHAIRDLFTITRQ
jgi:hypothetical protein